MESSGKRLQRLRKKLGMTAAEVARKADLTRSELSRWESGQREIPQTKRVRFGLSRAFNFEPSAISAYLDGLLPLSKLVPPPPTPLGKALELGHWSDATVQMARELEAQLRTKKRGLPIVEWVRQLDLLEEESRKMIRTRWERLLEDDGDA